MSFWDITNPNKPTGVKDPNAVLDYPIDWSVWLADISDTYASHTVVNITGGIAVESTTHANGIITVWLSGGTASSTATFTIRIVTTLGRTEDRTFYLKIKER